MAQADFSAEENTLPPGNMRPRSTLQKRAGQLLLGVAAYDDPLLVSKCPPGEISGAKVDAVLLLGSATVNAVGWSVGAQYLLGGGVHPVVDGLCIAAAGLIATADHQIFFRSKLFPAGLRTLANGGLSVDIPAAFSTSSSLAKSTRVGLCLAAGSLTAITSGMAFEGSTINAEIQREYLADNREIVDQASKDFEATRARAQAAYDAQQALAGGFARAQKADIDRAVRAARRSARNALPLQRADVQNSQHQLDEQNARLAALKDNLDHITAGRAEFIERAIEAAPDRIPKSDSLLGRMKALFRVLRDDPWAGLPLALFELVILGIDLLPLTTKLVYRPSTYSALSARQQLERIFEQSRVAAEHLKPAGNPATEARTQASPSPSASAANGGLPPRRRRGRPRKTPQVPVVA
jgi:Domain of unknown function (DUF4407)